MSQKQTDLYQVIIESIGDATPDSAKILSDVTGLPVEVVARAIYSAPNVLFSKIDKSLADQTLALLDKLGLQASVHPQSYSLAGDKKLVDVGLYIPDIAKLREINSQVALFIGCSEEEALKLLMNESGIILGNISLATAKALQKRISAELIISHPAEDLYTVTLVKEDAVLINQFKNFMKYLGLETDFPDGQIKNLDYETGKKIWQKFQSTGVLTLTNQQFLRYAINLEATDPENSAGKKLLTGEVGMPEEILEEVLASLPVELEESVSHGELSEKLKRYAAAGLTCRAEPISNRKRKIIIEEMTDLQRTRKVLQNLVPEENLPANAQRWTYPVPVGNLLGRYISYQLEEVDCITDFEYAD